MSIADTNRSRPTLTRRRADRGPAVADLELRGGAVVLAGDPRVADRVVGELELLSIPVRRADRVCDADRVEVVTVLQTPPAALPMLQQYLLVRGGGRPAPLRGRIESAVFAAGGRLTFESVAGSDNEGHRRCVLDGLGDVAVADAALAASLVDEVDLLVERLEEEELATILEGYSTGSRIDLEGVGPSVDRLLEGLDAHVRLEVLRATGTGGGAVSGTASDPVAVQRRLLARAGLESALAMIVVCRAARAAWEATMDLDDERVAECQMAYEAGRLADQRLVDTLVETLPARPTETEAAAVWDRFAATVAHLAHQRLLSLPAAVAAAGAPLWVAGVAEVSGTGVVRIDRTTGRRGARAPESPAERV